jgi:hypothetical protein
MKSLNIQGTQTTPAISADWEQGCLTMQGDSYPENSFEFFNPVIDWIDRFIKQSQAPLHLELHLLYLNTSSVKAMMDIFDMMEEAHGAGRKLSVRWSYDLRNERVMELAEEFREDCSFEFLVTADE